jgi:anti-sigma B factor antagonist
MRSPSDGPDAAVMANRPARFAVERTPLAGAPGVRVRGEVDMATAAELAAALDAAIRDTPGAFVVDLSETAFMDSSGLNVLLRARALLGRADRALVLVCPPGPARRVLEVAGIVDLLAPFDTLRQAAASLQPAGEPCTDA